jgi:uncharacterized membrane protein (UPF0136 family)
VSPREHIANIDDRGARRRALGGIVWLVVAVVATAALLATHAPRAYRLALVVPFALAALGWLQAREKT